MEICLKENSDDSLKAQK